MPPDTERSRQVRLDDGVLGTTEDALCSSELQPASQVCRVDEGTTLQLRSRVSSRAYISQNRSLARKRKRAVGMGWRCPVSPLASRRTVR